MTIGKECTQCISGFKQEKIYKDFQLKITSSERAALVENIVRSILPNYNLNNNLSSKHRLTILTLLQFAHKIEQSMFYTSNSRQEYLYLISKKIDYIRREFEERRLLRKIDSKISNWKQNELTDEKRQTIIKKLIQVLMPKVVQFDLRFLNFIKYVKRIEKLCYLKASSKGNYYFFLGEKMKKILLELKNKRDERKSLHAKEQTKLTINKSNDQLNEINDQANQLPKTDDKLKLTLNSIMKSFET